MFVSKKLRGQSSATNYVSDICDRGNGSKQSKLFAITYFITVLCLYRGKKFGGMIIFKNTPKVNGGKLTY